MQGHGYQNRLITTTQQFGLQKVWALCMEDRKAERRVERYEGYARRRVFLLSAENKELDLMSYSMRLFESPNRQTP